MEHFGLSSPATVHKHLQTLTEKGVFTRLPRKRRGLLIPEEAPALSPLEVELPFIGQVAAGYPLEFFAQTQSLKVPKNLVGERENCYLLQAQGDSMIDTLIADGDLLIVEPQTWAEESEMILGVLNTGQAVVKRFYWEEGGLVRLEAAAPGFQPITIESDKLTIHGTVAALMRLY